MVSAALPSTVPLTHAVTVSGAETAALRLKPQRIYYEMLNAICTDIKCSTPFV